MIFAKQKAKLIVELTQCFSLEFLSPMSEPSRVDLASENGSLRFKRPCELILLLFDSVVDANIGAFPVADS